MPLVLPGGVATMQWTHLPTAVMHIEGGQLVEGGHRLGHARGVLLVEPVQQERILCARRGEEVEVSRHLCELRMGPFGLWQGLIHLHTENVKIGLQVLRELMSI